MRHNTCTEDDEPSACPYYHCDYTSILSLTLFKGGGYVRYSIDISVAGCSFYCTVRAINSDTGVFDPLCSFPSASGRRVRRTFVRSTVVHIPLITNPAYALFPQPPFYPLLDRTIKRIILKNITLKTLTPILNSPVGF